MVGATVNLRERFGRHHPTRKLSSIDVSEAGLLILPNCLESGIDAIFSFYENGYCCIAKAMIIKSSNKQTTSVTAGVSSQIFCSYIPRFPS